MSGPTAAMTARQRATPPADKWHNRRGVSGGGYDTAIPLTLAPGMENEQARYPNMTTQDDVSYQRGPFYSAECRSPVGNGWVDWTAAGPPRAELHMRCWTWREEEGTSASRYPYIPSSPTGGRHTMTPTAVTRTMPRFVESGLPQMTSARVDRLSSARYAGQSYSQTTAVQGRAIPRGSRR